MKVPLIDVNAQNLPLGGRLTQKFQEVLSDGAFVLGAEVEALEGELAGLCGAEHGIGISSGSDALLVALMAAGVGPGDEVICPAFTFFATAGAVERLGATPVFADVLEETFNIDPRSLRSKISARTAAILPVHLFGQSADMRSLREIASDHHLTIIEDVAQAAGASFLGHGCGSMGDLGAFSFYPTKNLGGFGEGGMLTTNDGALAGRVRALRNHGMSARYRHEMVGGNFRLDALQAALLRVKLEHLEGYIEGRRSNATRYRQLLAGIDGLVLPTEADGCFHTWNQFTLRVTGGRRDALRAAFDAAGIGSEVYYPLSLDQQPCFRDLPEHAVGGISVAHRLAEECLSIPIFPEMSVAQQDAVIAAIKNFFQP